MISRRGAVPLVGIDLSNLVVTGEITTTESLPADVMYTFFPSALVTRRRESDRRVRDGRHDESASRSTSVIEPSVLFET